MRSRVDELTNRQTTVTLRQLVEQFPPDAGIIELLGYLQIARDDKHVISREKTEEILLAAIPPYRERRVIVPLVIFMPRIRSAHEQLESSAGG